MIRAKYAKAIRFGIEKAREVKFWPEEGNHYEKESEVRYYDFRTDLVLAELAFNRTHKKREQQYVNTLEDESIKLMHRMQDLDYVKWTETRQERYLRELNEKVQRLEAVVNDLKESSD